MHVKSRIQTVARSLALASMAIGCLTLGGAAGFALGASAAASASESVEVTDASQRWEDMNKAFHLGRYADASEQRWEDMDKAFHLGRYADASIVLEDIGFFE